MRDGWLRRSVKWVARLTASLDLRVRRAAGPAPRYRLNGTCNGCGQCCEEPALQVGRVAFRMKRLMAFSIWWQRAVNGFVLLRTDPRFHALIFRCTHYDPLTKLCDSYGSRPLMCRDYPRNLTHESNPVLFDECSYRIIDVNAAGLRAALEHTTLSPEQRAELEEKLKLRE